MKAHNLDRYYKHQSKIYDFSRNFFLFNHKEAVEQLSLSSDDQIMDVACGTGKNLSFILKQTKNLHGFDASSDMLKVAIRNFPGVKFNKVDASRSFTDQKFDKAICSYGLSIIEPWEDVIACIARSLKQDGKFVVLDFAQMYGVGKFIYPVVRWWLLKFGVDSEKDIEGELKKYFKTVKKIKYNWGYDVVYLAESLR